MTGKTPSRRLRGMVLGKFMPPHLGHVYLCEFAEAYCDELEIVVGSLAAEPILGAQRAAWMEELFPRARVVHLTDENPQYPHEHPDFWAIWKASLTRVLAGPVDVVFASEAYGWKLAEILGARFVPVDIDRTAQPVSGTAVRTDPMGNWAFLPRCVRPYFVRRVALVGPESTGKSTLARHLAARFATQVVPEYAEGLIARAGTLTEADIPLIGRAQAASEEALARAANRVLFCDSDLLTTEIWADRLFGGCPDALRAASRAARYDLTLLASPDVPFVDAGHRFLPNQTERQAMYERFTHELAARGRRTLVLSGSWEARSRMAEEAVQALLEAPGVAGVEARPDIA